MLAMLSDVTFQLLLLLLLLLRLGQGSLSHVHPLVFSLTIVTESCKVAYFISIPAYRLTVPVISLLTCLIALWYIKQTSIFMFAYNFVKY